MARTFVKKDITVSNEFSDALSGSYVDINKDKKPEKVDEVQKPVEAEPVKAEVAEVPKAEPVVEKEQPKKKEDSSKTTVVVKPKQEVVVDKASMEFIRICTAKRKDEAIIKGSPVVISADNYQALKEISETIGTSAKLNRIVNTLIFEFREKYKDVITKMCEGKAQEVKEQEKTEEEKLMELYTKLF